MKRYMNLTFLYAVLAMVGGVFYREFTKFNGFTDKTTLGVWYIPTTSCWGWCFSFCCCCWKRTFPSPGQRQAGY